MIFFCFTPFLLRKTANIDKKTSFKTKIYILIICIIMYLVWINIFILQKTVILEGIFKSLEVNSFIFHYLSLIWTPPYPSRLCIFWPSLNMFLVISYILQAWQCFFTSFPFSANFGVSLLIFFLIVTRSGLLL